MRSPLILSITTRGIGINLCSLYADLVYKLYIMDDDDELMELPNIYASYRALLALVESRFFNLASRAYHGHEVYEYSQILRDYYNIMNIPIIYKRYLDAINILQYKDNIYIPAMSRDILIDGQFIPRPENIVLSNLRKTVVALKATDVPEDDANAKRHRQNFYNNNPIPGAIWNTNNYKLINADEIIPPDYDLHNHVFDDMHKLLSLSMKLSHDTRYINKDCAKQNDTRQSFSSFICNEMGSLRVANRECEKDLNNYYRNCEPSGQIDSFYSRFRLRKDHIIKEGALFLLGEYPNNESFAKPIYELRSEHVNSYYYAQSRFHSVLYSSYHRDIVARSLGNA